MYMCMSVRLCFDASEFNFVWNIQRGCECESEFEDQGELNDSGYAS